MQCLEVAKEHLQGLWDYIGIRGIRQSRKHMTWYAKGFVGAAALRDRLCRIESVQDGFDCLDEAIAKLAHHQNDLGAISPEDMAEMIAMKQ
jgi:tRNA-dihydrouridine synthase